MTARHILSQYYSKSSITDVLSSVFPFITVTGILLIIAGFRNLIHYKSEIIVSLTTTISSAIVISTDIYSSKQNIVAYIDAQVTAFMLHYIGFKVAREGTIISLPSGSIEVYGACSSIVPLSSILPIVVIFLFVHPANKTKKIYVCIGVIVSVIFVNAIRLSWLAIIVKQDEIFKYWHHGDGVGIFSNLIVFLIGGLSYKILEYSAKTDQN
jgi:cyanoexosortase A